MLNNTVCLSLRHHRKVTEHYLMPWNEWSWVSTQVRYHVWRTLPVKGCLLSHKLERQVTLMSALTWLHAFCICGKICGLPFPSSITVRGYSPTQWDLTCRLCWQLVMTLQLYNPGLEKHPPIHAFLFPKKCGLFSQKHSLGCVSSLRASKVK